jgi:hypothetical protein
VVGGLAPHATSGGHSPPAGRRPPVPPTSAAGPIRRPTSLCVSPGASRRAWPPQACCASTARDWRGVARGVETDGSGREEHDRDLITAGGGGGCAARLLHHQTATQLLLFAAARARPDLRSSSNRRGATAIVAAEEGRLRHPRSELAPRPRLANRSSHSPAPCPTGARSPLA